MTRKSNVALAVGALVLGCSRPIYAAPPIDPCSLLTTSQVSSALGVTVGSGKAAGPRDCQWSQPGGGVGAKSVLLEILGPMGNRTPVDRFNTAKMPVPRVVKTPVSDLGDDAVYVQTLDVALYVKKSAFVFSIRVAGFPVEQSKAKEGALARDVLAKL